MMQKVWRSLQGFGDIAFAYASPRFPATTKYTAQEEAGHLADMRAATEPAIADVNDPSPFAGVEA